MDESKRVIVTCVDNPSEAYKKTVELKSQHKRAGFAEVRMMQNPPKTVHKYCVFYFKE